MPVRFHSLPYAATGRFSRLVTDYLAADPGLRSFYRFSPDREGIRQAIEERCSYPVNRSLLTDTLHRQYEGLTMTEEVARNLQALAQKNTFTVCTAHQPNLLTGYLYFVYKILHAIRLSDELNRQYPQQHFVPVYYMGSEDNDLDELGTFRYEKRKFIWDGGGQRGAVGRMKTKTLKTLLDELFRIMGPPGPGCDELKELLVRAYLDQPTIGAATRVLVNELFGRYGLVVLDPDDANFKKQVLPIMREDLLQHSAAQIVGEQIARLSEQYKVQAHPRPINLFYLADNLRERIERSEDRWQVLNGDVVWTQQELEQELEQHPERFSPNVILRGLLQERILPDVAFIGGGAEVAYWLQLRTLFEHHNVFFPALILRQSFHWMDAYTSDLVHKTGLDIPGLFAEEHEQTAQLISRHGGTEWQLVPQQQALEALLLQLKEQATAIDPTLREAAGAVMARIRRQVDALSKKMLRAEKKKHEIVLDRLQRIRQQLFPNNGLQERVENFLPFYLQYGPAFFDMLLRNQDPWKQEFIIAEEAGTVS